MLHCKSYSHFFSEKFQHICISLDVNFNESLTNDFVSFEQLGPEILNKWNLLESCIQTYLHALSVFVYFASVFTMEKMKIFDFYAPRRISGEHIVAASSVRPCVRVSVRPCVRASVPLLSTQILGNCLSDFNETSWEY